MNKFIILLTISIVALLSPSYAAPSVIHGLKNEVITDITQHTVVALWPKESAGVDPDIQEKIKTPDIRFYHIHNPNLKIYKPAKPNGTAIIICPGGAYKHISTGISGKPVAEILNRAGITAFVLKYRLPTTKGADFNHPVPVSDALRAIQFVRFYAKRFEVDPNKIGIMGDSAGGHLASSAGTLFSDLHFGQDDISKTSARPDFMCLVSPVITTQGKSISHKCTAYLLSKPSLSELRPLSSELNVTKNTPPTFLAHAKDDRSVSYQNSVLMHKALEMHGVRSSLNLYKKGGHGFGVGRSDTDSTKWIPDFISWMEEENITPKP